MSGIGRIERDDVTEAIDRDHGARRVGDARSRATRDRAAEPAIAAALCAPAHRDQSGAAALPALRRLVRAAIPAERHGALSANALLVGARLTRIFLSPLYGLVPSIYFSRHIFVGSARVDCRPRGGICIPVGRIMKNQTIAFVTLCSSRAGG